MTMTEAPPTKELHCWRCGRKLADLITPPYSLYCRRCKALNQQLDDKIERTR